MKTIHLLIFLIPVIYAGSVVNRKSEGKCQEYNELIKEKGICNNGEILDGVVQLVDYPFIGAIGYESDEEDGGIQWSCSGGLISDRYFLSNAHCARPLRLGPAKYILLGTTDLSSDNPNSKIYNISKIITYPNYTAPAAYDDIALFEIEKHVEFTKFIQPACLYLGEDYNQFNVVGFTRHGDSRQHDLLVQEKNDVASREECNKYWEPSRKLKNGVNFDTQFCNKEGHISCQIRSGGLYLHKDKNFSCTQSLAGLVSKGLRLCAGLPGLNVKVSAYVDWIESIIFV